MTTLRTLLFGAALALAATAPAASGEDPPFPVCADGPILPPVACVTNPPLCLHLFPPASPIVCVEDTLCPHTYPPLPPLPDEIACSLTLTP